MHRLRRLLVGLGFVSLGVGIAYAADQTLLGKQEQVHDPKPGIDATKRKLLGQGLEKASPVTIVGDPTVGGATLSVFAFGATSSNQVFDLLQGVDPVTGKLFWSGSTSKGFKYADKSGANGPVKVAQLKKSKSGTVQFKALAVAKNGAVNVVPPNPGTGGCILFEIVGGDRYHMRFDASAVSKKNDPKTFLIKSPTDRGFCPLPTTTTSTSSTSTTTSSTTTTTTSTTTTIPPCGTFLTMWGSAGSGDGQFNSSQVNAPFIVGVDATGNVFVSDSNNQRVQKFDNAGTFLTKWGTSGSGDGQFGAPFGLGFDMSGDVFVGDAGNNRVQVFTGTGAFVRQWGSTGSGSGQFNVPVGVGVDGSGDVFVAEFNNNRVQKFDNAGNLLLAFGWGVQDGMAAAETCSSMCGTGIAGSGDGQFTNPLALAVDGNGNVFVTESGPNCRVQKFTNTGTFVTKWSFPCPTGIAVGANGDVFVADDTSNVVRKYTNAGTFVTSWAGGAGGFSIPWGVAVDTSGNVFVGDRGNNRIQKFACP